jgi:hypothetical protein
MLPGHPAAISFLVESGCMLRPLVASFIVSLVTVPVAAAQQSPYVGRMTLPIKALTTDEIRDYLAGEGMGFALPAELNGYPGPRHVLDMADSLGLSDDRRAVVQQIFDRMHGEAVRLGTAIVAAEAGLDSAFAEHRVAADDLDARLTSIATLKGRLRYVHLDAHLQMLPLLTPEQIHMYQRLRGYGDGHGAGHHHGGSPESGAPERP